MTTLQDLIAALSRLGMGRVLTVGFGFACLVGVNLFRSTPTIDTIANVIFGGLIAAAIFLPKREE